MSLLKLSETASTNSWLKEHRAELSHGDAVTAARQTDGRGRIGHTWLGSDGMLPLSVLLRDIPYPDTITLTVGAAVCALLEELADEPVMIKWPNDIILRGHKLCGILCESVCGCDSIDIICGIGINVSQPTEFFEASGIPHGGSLKSLIGLDVNKDALAVKVTEQIIDYSGKSFDDIRNYYKAHCITLGKQVRIIKNGAEQVAFVEDIAENGHLVCHDESDSFEVSSGEVSVRGLLGYI